jgi:hypothetical protein
MRLARHCDLLASLARSPAAEYTEDYEHEETQSRSLCG